MIKDYDAILLSKVRDIHGLEGISNWPLAAGWWFLIFVLFTAIFVIIKKFLSIKQYRKGWRYRLEKELDNIVASENLNDAKKNVSRINDILKRLSIQLYGRKESASLAGKKWLVWLSNRDPNNFSWVKKGDILINYPYMPEDKIQASTAEIAVLAKAAKNWLRLDS